MHMRVAVWGVFGMKITYRRITVPLPVLTLQSGSTDRPTRKELSTVAFVALAALLFLVAFGWQGYVVLFALILWCLIGLWWCFVGVCSGLWWCIKETFELMSYWAFWQLVAFSALWVLIDIRLRRTFGDDWWQKLKRAVRGIKNGPAAISDFHERQPYGDAALASKDEIGRALTSSASSFTPKFED